MMSGASSMRLRGVLVGRSTSSRQDIKKAWKSWGWSPSKVDPAEDSRPYPSPEPPNRISGRYDVAHLLGYLPEGEAPAHKACDPSTEGRRTPCYPVSLDWRALPLVV